MAIKTTLSSSLQRTGAILLLILLSFAQNKASTLPTDTLRLKPGDSIVRILEKLQSNTVVHFLPGRYETNESIEITDASDITLLGAGKVEIICHDENAIVLKFRSCRNVTVDGLHLRHDLPEKDRFCTGGVITFWNSSDLTVRNCDINGCGTIGVELYKSTGLLLENNHIHDNSEYAVMTDDTVLLSETPGVNGVVFRGNKIENNGKGLLREEWPEEKKYRLQLYAQSEVEQGLLPDVRYSERTMERKILARGVLKGKFLGYERPYTGDIVELELKDGKKTNFKLPFELPSMLFRKDSMIGKEIWITWEDGHFIEFGEHVEFMRTQIGSRVDFPHLNSGVPAEKRRFVFARSGLNFREGPSLKSKKLLTIPYGAELEYIGEPSGKAFTVDHIPGKMVQARYQDKKGYVFDGYITPYPISSGRLDQYPIEMQLYGLDPEFEYREPTGDYNTLDMILLLEGASMEDAFLVLREMALDTLPFQSLPAPVKVPMFRKE